MVKSNLICRRTAFINIIISTMKVIKLKNTMTDLVYKKYGDVV